MNAKSFEMQGFICDKRILHASLVRFIYIKKKNPSRARQNDVIYYACKLCYKTCKQAQFVQTRFSDRYYKLLHEMM